MTDFLTDSPMPQPVAKAASGDWWAFRRKHADLGIAKTGEDGSISDWQAILREVGQDRLTAAVMKVRKTIQPGSKVWFAATLVALGGDSTEGSATPTAPTDNKAAKRSRIDLLVWCITHSPRCYADAICTYREDDDESSVRLHMVGTVRRKKRIRLESDSRYQALIDLATRIRGMLYDQTGIPPEDKYRTALYDAVRQNRTLLAWLRTQRCIP